MHTGFVIFSHLFFKQQSLNFFPDPHGQGRFLPTGSSFGKVIREDLIILNGDKNNPSIIASKLSSVVLKIPPDYFLPNHDSFNLPSS
jgi:hypothetical protein